MWAAGCRQKICFEKKKNDFLLVNPSFPQLISLQMLSAVQIALSENSASFPAHPFNLSDTDPATTTALSAVKVS